VCAFGTLIPLSAVILLGAFSYWKFGPATHLTAASLAPHWSLKNAIFWSTVFFAFVGVESGSAMGDEIRNPRRVIPYAILAGGAVLAIGYLAGTASLLIALPSQAVGGPDGFVDGIRALSTRLGVAWLLACPSSPASIITCLRPSEKFTPVFALPGWPSPATDLPECAWLF